MSRIIRAIIILTMAFPCLVSAESDGKILERIDSYLAASDMRSAIAIRMAWLVCDMGIERLSLTPNKEQTYGISPEVLLNMKIAEFLLLYANRAFEYEQPNVPIQWSAFPDSYRFGHAKGTFDAIRLDGSMIIYDGSGDIYDAFSSGFDKGFEEGKARRLQKR